MLDWLKTILGDTYTDEIEKKVSEEIGKGFVAKSDFNTANEAKKLLDTQLKERDIQLEALKKVDAEGLQAEIARLQGENKTVKEQYENDLKSTKLNSALELKLIKEGAVNAKAVKALLDLDKISLDNDNLVGIDEQLSALKESDKWAFGEQMAASTGMAQGAGAPAIDPVEAAFYSKNPDLKPTN